MERLKEVLTIELQTYLQQEDRAIPKLLAKIERSTNVKRENVVYCVLLAVALYLVLGHRAELLCNTIGFAYPAYESFKAIETVDKADDTQWLTYWAVFAAISLVDFASDKIMGFFPIYWLVKCVFLLWLYMPVFRGAERLYKNVLGPAFKRIRPTVEGVQAEVQQQAEQIAAAMLEQQQQLEPPQLPSEMNAPPLPPADEGTMPVA